MQPTGYIRGHLGWHAVQARLMRWIAHQERPMRRFAADVMIHNSDQRDDRREPRRVSDACNWLPEHSRTQDRLPNQHHHYRSTSTMAKVKISDRDEGTIGLRSTARFLL
jgi:hypothetical protein